MLAAYKWVEAKMRPNRTFCFCMAIASPPSQKSLRPHLHRNFVPGVLWPPFFSFGLRNRRRGDERFAGGTPPGCLTKPLLDWPLVYIRRASFSRPFDGRRRRGRWSQRACELAEARASLRACNFTPGIRSEPCEERALSPPRSCAPWRDAGACACKTRATVSKPCHHSEKCQTQTLGLFLA